MSGLAELVPVSELLESLRGSKSGATALAVEVMHHGQKALPPVRDDLTSAVREKLVATGVLREDGHADVGKANDLIRVCDVLAAATTTGAAPADEPILYLSGRSEVVTIQDRERLDGLVLDVIRGATNSLVIGGAFWNREGFDILAEVLGPALSVRAVPTTIYANLPAQDHDSFLQRVTELATEGPMTVKFFAGPEPTMLHAKFVIRDGTQGYLGTANFTSWGMHRHIEAGVELSPGQCRRLLSFLKELEDAHLFVERDIGPALRGSRVGNEEFGG